MVKKIKDRPRKEYVNINVKPSKRRRVRNR